MARIHRTDVSQIPATPEDGAAYWHTREKTAALTRQEHEARARWMEEPEHREAYIRAAALWGELGQLAAHEQMRRLRREALDANPAARRVSLRWPMAAAAALAAVLAGGYLIYSFKQPHRDAAAKTAGDPAPGHYQTAVGERLTATLKDGSAVTLNTASELRVRFTEAERVVELTRGQAYFAVAQDQRHPFVVLAGGRRIVALGTAFDVRLDRGAVQVLLVEGRVAVNAVAAPKSRIELEPGERFISRDEDSGSVSTANVDTSTSWRSGRIVFDDTPLAEAVAEVNRYRDRPIVLGDAAAGSLKISGTYRVSEAGRFPQVLAAYYPLEATTRSSGETVLSWRQRSTSGASP